MNKHEAIENINGLWSFAFEDGPFEVDLINKRQAIDIISQIDEPQKPVVPKFVADWYEEHKDNFEIYLSELCRNFTFNRERLNDKLANWYEQLENKPIQTLVNMHQFGYEIKKEKLYEVFLKRSGAQLGVCVPHGEDKTQFTKVELQEYDFDNLDVYEVEEVDE